MKKMLICLINAFLYAGDGLACMVYNFVHVVAH